MDELCRQLLLTGTMLASYLGGATGDG